MMMHPQCFACNRAPDLRGVDRSSCPYATRSPPSALNALLSAAWHRGGGIGEGELRLHCMRHCIWTSSRPSGVDQKPNAASIL